MHIAPYTALFGKQKIEINNFVGISSRVSIYTESDDFVLGISLANPTIPDKYRKIFDKGKVTLKAKSNKDKPFILIPFEYWQYDYPNYLSLRAKYMYLICLYEAARSTRYPSWFRSQKDMSKLYGISDTTISLGLLELEERGIIEITRDKPTPPNFSDRVFATV